MKLDAVGEGDVDGMTVWREKGEGGRWVAVVQIARAPQPCWLGALV